MPWTADHLLEHLPQLYRQRDEEIALALGQREGPLRALAAAMAAEIGRVEGQLDQLHDNAFVETCEAWVLPYLAQLLGIDELPATAGSVFTPRAFVANTLDYRRRKGTPAMLEQLARDLTGWYAHVVEFFLHLVQTQHSNHRRPDAWLVPNLRDLDALERLGTPFNSIHHLPEVRRIAGAHSRGRFNLPNLGIHLWPLRVFTPPEATLDAPPPVARFALEARPALPPANPGDPVERWFLHPLGHPVRLFNRPLGLDPASGATVTDLAARRDVPDPLRRLPLHRELEALRQSLADALPPADLLHLGAQRPVFQLFPDDEPNAIPAAEIVIADFSRGWTPVESQRTYRRAADGAPVDLPVRVAVDPVLGQVAFAAGRAPARLRAVWARGFSAPLGAGPYDRREAIPSDLVAAATWQRGVSRLLPAEPGILHASFADAVEDWNLQPPGTIGILCLMDSQRYEADLVGALRLRIPERSRLLVVAADWPALEQEPGVWVRPVGTLSADRLQPHLLGALEIEGTAPTDHPDPGTITFHGLLLDGPLRVLPGHLGALELAHVSLPPVHDRRLRIDATLARPNSELAVTVTDSIVGGLVVADTVSIVTVTRSILGLPDQPAAPALAAPGAVLRLDQSTVWGGVQCRQFDASEVLFSAPVIAERRQEGCVRFSYLPAGSLVPRRYRCQPDWAIHLAGAENDPVAAHAIRVRTRPVFASDDPREATFARLAPTCPAAIAEGGENGREMGVFAPLEAPLHLHFLERSLDEYLRAGLQAGLDIETVRPPVNYGNP